MQKSEAEIFDAFPALCLRPLVSSMQGFIMKSSGEDLVVNLL